MPTSCMVAHPSCFRATAPSSSLIPHARRLHSVMPCVRHLHFLRARRPCFSCTTAPSLLARDPFTPVHEAPSTYSCARYHPPIFVPEASSFPRMRDYLHSHVRDSLHLFLVREAPPIPSGASEPPTCGSLPTSSCVHSHRLLLCIVMRNGTSLSFVRGLCYLTALTPSHYTSEVQQHLSIFSCARRAPLLPGHQAPFSFSCG
jgi:hypothetical protein